MTVGLDGPQVDSPAVKSAALSRRPSPPGCGWPLALPICLLLGLSLGNCCVAQAPASPDDTVDCELRIVWGGPQPRPVEGAIAIDRGTLTPLRNLNLQADAIATVRSTGLSSLEILPSSPTQFGGVDLRLRGDMASQLRLTFKDPFTSEPVEHVVAVSELLQGSWLKPLDARGTQLSLERQVADRLRVELERDHTVFEVGEAWRTKVSGYRTGLPAGEYELRSRWLGEGLAVSAEQTHGVTLDASGSFPAIELELKTPATEGAHLVEFSLVRRRFLNSLVSTGNALTRRLDVVALDSTGRAAQISGWQPLLSIDVLAASEPGSLAWLAPLQDISKSMGVPEKWQQYYPLSASLKTPLSHGQLAARALPALGQEKVVRALTLAPHSWLAIPLSGLAEGKPHRLRVQLPTDQPMELAVSVRSPDADGNLPALSRDAGFVINARECSADGQLAKHDITFWPTAGSNYVLLANTSTSSIATICNVDVEAATLVQPPARGEAPVAGRRVGLYLDKPLLADSFSVPRTLDPNNSRPLDSWQTWFTAAERLDQTMKWTEVDTLLLKVFADGGAIFPSQHLAPSLRFDNGPFFSDGRDAMIKDYVELLLRRFDREGKHLVLAIDLDTALPALDRFEESEPALLQRNFDGATWPLATARDRQRHVRYNPLNARVQAELLAMLQEIVARYADHPAFGGVSLQLDQESQFIFAGDKWGLDAGTLAQFASAQQVKLPPPERLRQSFHGPTRLAFLNWRAAELAKLYGKMSEVIQSQRPDCRLYLNALRLWENRPNENDFWEPESVVRNPGEYLLAFGIDTQRIDALPGVTLMQGRLDRSWESVDSNDWILELASARALQPSGRSGSAALVLQQPRGFQLEGIEQLGRVSVNASAEWVFPYSTAHAHFARKELIHQIYNTDPQLLVSGGWLPAGGQDASLQTLYRTLRELPPVAFQEVAMSEPPTNLRARTVSHDSKTFIQLVNNAPWVETVTLQLQLTGAQSPATRLLGDPPPAPGARRFPARITRTSPATWEIEVPPFDLVALEIDDPRLIVAAVAHSSGKGIVPRIAAELEAIENIIADAGDPTQQQRLAQLNGDFEHWSSETKPRGWNVSSLPGVLVYASTELPHSGKAALVIENRSGAGVAAWVQSQPITPPRTGRLTVQAWLRAPTASGPSTVRLSVVGRLRNGGRFERSEDFGGTGETRAIANDWGRRPAKLYVADVPTEDLVDLHVAIDLIGPGKVWVDDVEVFESLLHPDERIYLRGQVLVAKQNLEERNPYPAERLLDSHWGLYLSAFRPDVEGTRLAKANAAQTTEQQLKASSKWNQPKPLFQQWRESFQERWKR